MKPPSSSSGRFILYKYLKFTISIRSVNVVLWHAFKKQLKHLHSIFLSEPKPIKCVKPTPYFSLKDNEPGKLVQGTSAFVVCCLSRHTEKFTMTVLKVFFWHFESEAKFHQTCFQSGALWLFLCDLLWPKNGFVVEQTIWKVCCFKNHSPPHATHCFPVRQQH